MLERLVKYPAFRRDVFEGGVYLTKVLMKIKENRDISIKQDKEIKALNYLGEGILAVLSGLILATKKKKTKQFELPEQGHSCSS